MNPSPRPAPTRLAFFSLSALVLILVAVLALPRRNDLVLVVALVLALALLATVHWLLAQADARAAVSARLAGESVDQLHRFKVDLESRSTDLALLGRFGNLLIGCTDLAEALQISEQMLSILLPECAGTIYPLIDGEGLAEATHLWGVHVGDTRLQASAEDCWCMRNRRTHLGNGGSPDSLCSHVIAPSTGELLNSACIPLIAQGESLGWIYLSSPAPGPFPKLQIAVAAADQLALALANLKLRHSLRDLSVRDPLTGLFNRRYLSESLAREISRSKRRVLPLAVLAFDLDHFKSFNDSYGHPAGDAILVAFARVLQANSRSEDIACRLGGEEFVLIMPEMDITIAMRRASDLIRLISSMDVLHEGQVLPKVTTSIGLAMYPEHGSTSDLLLAQADQALYQAKQLGRNRVALPAVG